MIAPYYLLDWSAMAFSLVAVWLLGNKSRWGFPFFVLANLLWIVVGVLAGSYAIVVGNLTFLVMNTRGFFRWARPAVVETLDSSR